MTGGASTEKRVIKVTVDQVNNVLGIEVPEADMVRILKALQFEVEAKDGELTLAIPRYRDDIEGYQDIAEEVIREYGYDKVIPTFLDDAKVTNGGLNRYQSKELAVKEYLCSQGYFEIQTIAMTAKTDFDTPAGRRYTDPATAGRSCRSRRGGSLPQSARRRCDYRPRNYNSRHDR